VLKGQGTAWFDELRLDVIGTAIPTFEPLEPPADVIAGPTAPAEPDSQLDAADILQVSRALQQAVADLESTNARIMERVQTLQDDLARSRADAAALQALPTYGPHPLVPHGYKPEENSE
jgi:hypothetical protein